MIESRCGIKCSECEYKQQVGCPGCLHITKPFWGEKCAIKDSCETKGYQHCGMCKTFPCNQLKTFAYDEKQGDDGKRILQCQMWKDEEA